MQPSSHTHTSLSHPTAVLDRGISLLSRFYFPLIFHFFDGSLDSFLITQKLVRAQGVQILIKFKEYGHTSGEGDIDDVLIRDACQRKTEQSYTSSFLTALFLRLPSQGVLKNLVKDTFQPPSIAPATQGSIPSLGSALGTDEGENSHQGKDSFSLFQPTCMK